MRFLISRRRVVWLLALLAIVSAWRQEAKSQEDDQAALKAQLARIAALRAERPHDGLLAYYQALTHVQLGERTAALAELRRPIGIVRSLYAATGEVPKGLGAEHRAEGTIEIFPEYETGLQDIEGFSHLYVLWVFDRAGAPPETWVGTPPTDDRPHGVFATRSPRRPNPLALTVIELLGRKGRVLSVRGIDMLDGTPVLDLKPYLSNIPEEKLRRGWLAEAEARRAAASTPDPPS